MSYRALLFCADDKASRAVTQVFRELDFHVESSHEPFDAVKRLTAQHFDALVVDCDNEENATLLFKSARNSASNKNSLAVAVVEGQANIAKAFRLGANLVLTKPINLEQAKGTLRVARGLLRKAESKLNLAGPLVATDQTGGELETSRPAAFHNSVLTPVPIEPPLPVASAALEVENQPGSPEAASIDSLAKAAGAQSSAASARQAAAAAPAKESQWASKPEVLEPKPVAADEVKRPKKKEEPAAQGAKQPAPAAKPSSTLRFASLGINADESANAEQSKKNFWIAAIIVLALGGAVYYGWTKYHPAIHLPFAQNEAPVPAPPAPPVPKPPALESSAAPQPDANAALAAATEAVPTPTPAPADTNTPVGLAKVSESVAEGLLIKRVDPNYPDKAREQKLDGLVQLRANINKSGDVTGVKALHGNALLVEAATAAVKQWKYKPYYVNGAPTDIETSITLNFKPQ